jgi:hypothetical protein
VCLGADVVTAVVQRFNTSTNCILIAVSLNVLEHERDSYIKFVHALYYSPAVENVVFGTVVQPNPFQTGQHLLGYAQVPPLVVLNDKRTAPFFEVSRRVADKIEVPYRTRNDARAAKEPIRAVLKRRFRRSRTDRRQSGSPLASQFSPSMRRNPRVSM